MTMMEPATSISLREGAIPIGADVVKAPREIKYGGFLNIEFNPAVSEEFAGKDYAESVKPGIALLRKIIAES